MKTIGFIILFFILLFSSCDKLFPDEKLTLQRRDYLGNELRTDGYYYYFNSQNSLNKEYIVVHVLYRNGIIRLCGSSESFQDFENKIDIYNTSNVKSYKEFWGVFIIEDDKITCERWRFARIGERRPTHTYIGKILNDTTINITESYYSNEKKRNTADQLWHFKQFSPKPDSTNSFIK